MALFMQMASGDYSPLDGVAIDFATYREATICILGAAWALDLVPSLRWAKEKHACKIVVLIYDIIPIRHPEFVTADLTDVFEKFIVSISSIADTLLTISRYVAEDLKAFLQDSGLRTPLIEPLQLSTFDTMEGGDARPLTDIIPNGPYVLFVSTIEIRKNHQLLYDIWKDLLEAGHQMPDLVFVGRMGWKVEPLIEQIEQTSHLRGKLHMLQDVSDRELAELYRRAEFLAYPSFTEGWGLPVTEALALGTPVLSSNRASLTEAGRTGAVYLDPEDKPAWKESILKWTQSPGRRPTIDSGDLALPTWDDVLHDLLAACRSSVSTPEQSPTVSTETFLPVYSEGIPSGIISYFSRKKAPQKFQPTEVRIGPNWSRREHWGSWATRGRLRASFLAKDLSTSSALALFMQFPQQLVGRTVVLDVNGYRYSAKIEDGLCLFCVRPGVKTKRKLLKLDVEMSFVDRSALEIATTIDIRSPCFGLQAIAMIEDQDIETWSMIVTKIVHEGRRLEWL